MDPRSFFLLYGYFCFFLIITKEDFKAASLWHRMSFPFIDSITQYLFH